MRVRGSCEWGSAEGGLGTTNAGRDGDARGDDGARGEPRFSVDREALSLLWPLVEDERLTLEQRVALTLSLAELDQVVSARSLELP